MAFVIIGTALIIVLTYVISNSWGVSSAAGVIAAVLTVAMYPVLFKKRA